MVHRTALGYSTKLVPRRYHRCIIVYHARCTLKNTRFSPWCTLLSQEHCCLPWLYHSSQHICTVVLIYCTIMHHVVIIGALLFNILYYNMWHIYTAVPMLYLVQRCYHWCIMFITLFYGAHHAFAPRCSVLYHGTPWWSHKYNIVFHEAHYWLIILRKSTRPMYYVVHDTFSYDNT